MTTLTPADFDAATAAPIRKKERLSGAPEIARAIGCSEDSIARLARIPGVPIFKPPGFGRYVANRSELESWMRTKPN